MLDTELTDIDSCTYSLQIKFHLFNLKILSIRPSNFITCLVKYASLRIIDAALLQEYDATSGTPDCNFISISLSIQMI
jgi:hypothetical protein